MQWDDAQALWRPATDARGKSSLAGVWIAGDAAGIGGARAAEEAGRLAALDVLSSLDRLAGAGLDAEAEAARKGFRRAIFGRALIDTLYTPPAAARRGPAEAIVCRCEALTGERLSEAAKTLAVAGPNQLKALLRCGMGPCQGRMCGPVLTEVIAHAQGRPQSEVGPLRQRPPVKPMTVGELARTRFPPAG
jgi:NADPH-dependent 2,4-dienoyl-CoA reductase/sulfur reductase-like enzyme